MNKTKNSTRHFAILFGAVLVTALTGCRSDQQAVYSASPPEYPAAQVMARDNYVYYPGYQVYYGSNSHQYFYREGRSWVTRPAPSGVSAAGLIASPSVRLDFHDDPELHHAQVVQQYPKDWKPAEDQRSRGQ